MNIVLSVFGFGGGHGVGFRCAEIAAARWRG
jgi:hypothetical protein